MKRITALIVLILFTAGCATRPVSYVPFIDQPDNSPEAIARFNFDLNECQAIADKVRSEEQVAGGAVAGALFGLALGALVGFKGSDLARMAGSGALGGSTGAAVGSNQKIMQIVSNCMAGRGYKVVG